MTELERLQAIEARLIARYQELFTDLQANTHLLRREQLELNMRFIEDVLGYRPARVSKGRVCNEASS